MACHLCRMRSHSFWHRHWRFLCRLSHRWWRHQRGCSQATYEN